MEDEALVFDVDAGFGVDGEGELEGVEEGGLDLADEAEAGAELGVDGGPGDGGGFAEGVEAVGEPDVDVDGEGFGADGAEGFFADGDGVVAEGAPEAFVEADAVLPEGGLGVVGEAGEGDAALDEGAVAAEFGVGEVGEEGEAASGDATGLFGDELVGFAACGEGHAGHPGLHGAAEFDFGVAGSNGFGLEVEEDEAGDAAVGDADGGAVAVAAGFDEKGGAVALAFPEGVGDAFVGEGGHGKAGVGDAEPGFFFGEEACGGFDGLAVRLAVGLRPGSFDAVAEDQPMDFTHGRFCGGVLSPDARWTLLTQAISRLLGLSY